MAKKEIIVVSVGGSLVVPNQIDTEFLSQLKKFVFEGIEEGYRFALITGGGNTARSYQGAAKDLTDLTPEDVDWLGIHSCRLNAHLLRAVFEKVARPAIVKNPNRIIFGASRYPVIIGTGWKPGSSSDYVAVRLARNLSAKKVVNLSDIDYVYTKDPKHNPDAEPLKKVSWADFRNIIPKEWSPGIHSPFDPVAAKEAERLELEVAIIHGKHFDRFKQYLRGEEMIGTIIS